MWQTPDCLREDPEIAAAIQAESARQEAHIELIASENFVSPAVMAAMGSPLTNKYAEGYPGRRYYGGCACVDEVERITGIDFFPSLPDDVENKVEAKANIDDWM